MNPRVTKREWGLIKGALRRVFSRSELRRVVLDAAEVKDYFDPKRQRVTKWCKCASCGKLEPKYKCVVDHIDPVVPFNTSFEQMSLDYALERLFCDIINLQVLDEKCHYEKTKAERLERKKQKGDKNGKRRKY